MFKLVTINFKLRQEINVAISDNKTQHVVEALDEKHAQYYYRSASLVMQNYPVDVKINLLQQHKRYSVQQLS